MKIFISILLALPFRLLAQTPSSCDSLYINCCKNNPTTHSQLTLIANNQSSNLYGYPGFVLLNAKGDTIAKENVNYFGIGKSNQKHIMEMRNTIDLPFAGTLLLYSGFYKKFECSFSITFKDTATGVRSFAKNPEFDLYPNPAQNSVAITFKQNNYNHYSIRILDAIGQVCLDIPENSPSVIDLTSLKQAGLYMVQVYDATNPSIASKKLIINR